MKVIKTKEKKYPLILYYQDKKIKIPKQANFSNTWLRTHGCSIMAEYIALQYLGKHIWPVNLLKWHKQNTKTEVKAKVTLKGITKGINHFFKGRAKYIHTPTFEKVDNALKNNHIIIFEQKNPIHSIVIFRDNNINYMITYGKVIKINLKKIVKTKSSNKTYRGMIII